MNSDFSSFLWTYFLHGMIKSQYFQLPSEMVWLLVSVGPKCGCCCMRHTVSCWFSLTGEVGVSFFRQSDPGSLDANDETWAVFIFWWQSTYFSLLEEGLAPRWCLCLCMEQRKVLAAEHFHNGCARCSLDWQPPCSVGGLQQNGGEINS